MGHLATLALCAALAAAAPPAEVIDRVVAVVTGGAAAVASGSSSAQAKVITLSMLEFEARLHIILISRGRTTVATAPLDRDTLRATLTYVIGQDLLYDQASLLGGTSTADTNKVADLHNDLASFLGGADKLNAFLARFDIHPEHLTEILERDVLAQHYLELKLGIEAKLTQAEIDTFAADHAVELAIYADPDDQRRAALAGASHERDVRLERAQLRQLYSHAKVRIADQDFAGADAAFQPVDEGTWK